MISCRWWAAQFAQPGQGEFATKRRVLNAPRETAKPRNRGHRQTFSSGSWKNEFESDRAENADAK